MSDYALTRIRTIPDSMQVVKYHEPVIINGANATWDAYVNAPGFNQLYEIRSPTVRGNRRIWKSFEHYKSVCDSGSGGLGSAVVTTAPHFSNDVNAVRDDSPAWSLYSGIFGAPGYLDNGLDPLYIPTAGVSGFVPEPSNLDSLIANSIRAMLPTIKAGLSLVNTVLELKDFKSLPRTIKGLNSLPKLLLRKGRKFRDLHQMLQVAADLYLQKSFNISPLISDIRAIYDGVAKAQKRMNALISRAGKLEVSHYTRPLDPGGISVETSGAHSVGSFRLFPDSGLITGYASAVETRYVVAGPSVFHSQLEYNYRYTQYQLEHARSGVLLDHFGLNFDPSIVWNAIPWSFVVDWLVDVGQWLRDQKVGTMDPQINIMQYLWSVKYSRRIYVTSRVTSPIHHPSTGLTSNYVQSITHPVVTQTAYRRDAGLPTASLLTTSGLNPGEFSLAVALVLGRRTRRTMRP